MKNLFIFYDFSILLVSFCKCIDTEETLLFFNSFQDYTNDKGDDRVKLTLAQLYLGQGSVFQACDVLKSMGVIQYTPGVVSNYFIKGYFIFT